MSRRAVIIDVILAWSTLIVSGCGDKIKRQEITGEVKFQGQPVEAGIINFAPLDGQGTGDGAQIVNGCVALNSQSFPKMSSARSRHQPGGVNVVYCDGHVAWVPNTVTLAVWRALSTSDGGETISN